MKKVLDKHTVGMLCSIHTNGMFGGRSVARNKYPEETVNQILEASYRLFMEKGYEHTSRISSARSMA